MKWIYGADYVIMAKCYLWNRDKQRKCLKRYLDEI